MSQATTSPASPGETAPGTGAADLDAFLAAHHVLWTDFTRKGPTFRPFSREERATTLEEIGKFTEIRNGAYRFRERELGQRDRLLARLRAHAPAPLDLAGLPDDAPQRLWLGLLRQIDRLERHSVEYELSRGHEPPDDLDGNLVMQEVYHSRFIALACRALGSQPDLSPPPASSRWPMHVLIRCPARVRRPFILSSEVVGLATFALLHREAHHFPEPTASHLRTVTREIYVDEFCHVLYHKALCSPAEVRAAGLLLAPVAEAMRRYAPQLDALHGGRTAYVEALAVRDPDTVVAVRP